MQATIEAAIKGDVDAQTKIVDEYSERIFNLGLHLLKNEHDAEDMLQETFIKVFEHLPNFEGRANLYTWIYRIATNIALMKLRRGEERPWSMTFWKNTIIRSPCTCRTVYPRRWEQCSMPSLRRS
jgi:DNA-directed RNA polymerase specialized sigma24 family protein